MIVEILEQAGFRLEQNQWLCPDPRGLEYGCFMARLDLTGGTIEVAHQRDGYSMTFRDVAAFTNWAKATL